MIEQLTSLKGWEFEPSGENAWKAYSWADFCGNDIAISFYLHKNGDGFLLRDYKGHTLQAVRLGFVFDSEIFDLLKMLNADSLVGYTAHEGVAAQCSAQDLPLVLNDALQWVLDFSFWCREHGHILSDNA